MADRYISDAKSEKRRGVFKEGLATIEQQLKMPDKQLYKPKELKIYKGMAKSGLERLTKGRPEYEKKSLKKGK